MIDRFWLRDEGQTRTAGCSCCSYTFDDIDKDKEEILKSLVDNLETVDKALAYYGISIRKFRTLYMQKDVTNE